MNHRTIDDITKIVWDKQLDSGIASFPLLRSDNLTAMSGIENKERIAVINARISCQADELLNNRLSGRVCITQKVNLGRRSSQVVLEVCLDGERVGNSTFQITNVRRRIFIN